MPDSGTADPALMDSIAASGGADVTRFVMFGILRVVAAHLRSCAAPSNGADDRHAMKSKLRVLRAERDMPQAELADLLGVSRQTV